MKDPGQLKDGELVKMVQEKKRAIQDMQFSLSKSKPGEQSIAGLKKEIAQLLTELSSRQANS